MRLLIVFGIALALAGCDKSEEDARRALTAAQAVQNEGRMFVALEAFEAIGKKYPQTTAATDAMNAARPLRQQFVAARNACDSYALDVGEPPNEVGDLYRNPPGVKGWRGPYAAPGQLGQFGQWAAATRCDLFKERWPADNQPSANL
ncbi:hypothetical protein [Tahibacter harae]|uniref:Lipoprotein n=1 Tax=Tahibacter harae TaxID=2963937 RepID=A0ABT1QS66_9GAMM|nr:hypothetical protein [Tahibacter harae]MCQ4165140.1 hypothetical protein [Tahibacter harae]